MNPEGLQKKLSELNHSATLNKSDVRCVLIEALAIGPSLLTPLHL